MSGFKYTLSSAEVRDAINYSGIKRSGAHSFSERVFHWPFCKFCGLVQLKNPASRKAARGLCVVYE